MSLQLITPPAIEPVTLAEAKAPETSKAPAAADAGPGDGRRQGGRMNSEAPNEVYQFAVLCLDRATGKTLWQKAAREEVPHEGHQQNNTYASASAVTDGHLVFAAPHSRTAANGSALR